MRYLSRGHACRNISLPGVFLLCVAAAGAVQAGPPRLPAPPKSRTGMLGDDMKVNGIDMDIRQFQSDMSLPEVVRYYSQYWPKGTSDKPGYMVTQIMKPWTIVTRAENEYLMTVQVKPEKSGSSGYLAISRLPDPDIEPAMGKGFPTLHGSTAMNDVESTDLGKRGRTMTFVNDRSADANASYYRNYYQARGWTLDMDKSPGENAHVLAFRSGDKSVNININGRSGRTYIVAQATNL